MLESPLFERAFLDITSSVFACMTQQLWEEVFRPLEQSECEYPQEHLQQQQQQVSQVEGEKVQALKANPGSPNSPVELGSPESSPENKEGNKKDTKKRRADEHKFRDASIPLAKLLPKIKAVAFK